MAMTFKVIKFLPHKQFPDYLFLGVRVMGGGAEEGKSTN